MKNGNSIRLLALLGFVASFAANAGEDMCQIPENERKVIADCENTLPMPSGREGDMRSFVRNLILLSDSSGRSTCVSMNMFEDLNDYITAPLERYPLSGAAPSKRELKAISKDVPGFKLKDYDRQYRDILSATMLLSKDGRQAVLLLSSEGKYVASPLLCR